jgi:magnesium-transporting ATPase (P-type)
MITGDHAVTARAIAGQLGFDNTLEALTGPEIETLTDQELGERVASVDVFARASPEHKLRLVEALQARGAVVAMTGDGVNDAPALKRADVGVAMGIKGTEAAKEAAQVVLADDNFASIASAVREGRTVYDNLKKTITFFLPINGGESLSIVVAILIGVTLPITPLQVLWINMVSSLCLALALAFEPTEPDTMSRPPRSPDEPILSRFLVWRIAFVSTLFLIGIFSIFEWALSQGANIEKARTLAVNTLVVMEVFYLFSVRFLRTPSLTLRGIFGTPVVLASVTAVIVLQLVFTYAPFMERFFDTRPISLAEGWPVIMAGVLLFIILEIEKAIRSRWRDGRRVDRSFRGLG